ncbi:hypothetical protein [Halorussus amylolyticus]|uniref:hypothetical protein n=1 Tax=Halorussus amylolyticus TaxID=1126242 RepID=UPI001051D411|nr:hypothetical protein [Halorussus amylolyticus]
MPLRSKVGSILAFLGSLLLGGATAQYYDELWVGILATALLGVVSVGFVQFPRLLGRTVFSGRSGWQSVFGVLTVLVLFTPQESDIFATDYMYAKMLFLWGVLVCGVVVGISIGRATNTGE